MNSLKKNLDTVVNIATLISIISLIAFLGYKWAFPPTQQSSYKENFAEGRTLAEIPTLNEDKFEKSVILILNTDCKYCNASLDFYKKLSSVRYNANSRQLTALFLQSEEVVKKYVKDKDFPIRTISAVDFGKLGVGLTPTIVVVDQQRRVTKSWFGQLKSEQEQEVVNSLER
jgi:hypothetical protein